LDGIACRQQPLCSGAVRREAGYFLIKEAATPRQFETAGHPGAARYENGDSTGDMGLKIKAL